jgi:hypothetical protein
MTLQFAKEYDVTIQARHHHKIFPTILLLGFWHEKKLTNEETHRLGLDQLVKALFGDQD